MEARWRYGLGVSILIALFVVIQFGGLYLVTPLVGEEPSAGTNPGDPAIGVLFVVALLIATAIMLGAFRWGLGWLIRGVVLLVSLGLSWVVIDVVLPPLLIVSGLSIIPVVIAVTLVGLLIVHPEWYVLDVVGVLVGAGAVALLGASIGVSAAIGLLVILAVYDLISVYGTKHMLTLAEGAMRGHLPVILVVPLSLPFSMRSSSASDDDTLVPEGALIIGLGDAVIPGLLAISAAVYGPVEPSVVAGIAISAPVLGVIGGTVVGLLGLFTIPEKDTAHPGLPFLTSGAIAGYLIGAMIVGINPIEAIAAGLIGWL